MTLDHDRVLDRTSQPLGDTCRVQRTEPDLAGVVGLLGGPVDEHDELVAAESRQLITDTHDRTEPPCDVAEEFVTDAVAEAVVDDLEVVEIDEQHGDLVAARRRQQLVEPRHDRRPVRQLGQRVVSGRMGEALGRNALLGDVLDVRDRQRHAVLLDHRHLSLRPHELTVAAKVPLFGPVTVVDTELDPRPLGGSRAQILGMGDLTHRPAQEVPTRVIEQVGERLVRIDDAIVGQPDQSHAGRRRMERLMEPTSSLLQRLGGPLTVADIAQDHDRPTQFVGDGVQRGLDQPGRAVPIDQFERRWSRRIAVGVGMEPQATPPIGDVVAIVVGHESDERAADQFADRTAGQLRRALVCGHDRPVDIETQDSIGEAIEQVANPSAGGDDLVDGRRAGGGAPGARRSRRHRSPGSPRGRPRRPR